MISSKARRVKPGHQIMIRLVILCLTADALVGCSSTGGGGSMNTGYSLSPTCNTYDFTNTGTCPLGRQWH